MPTASLSKRKAVRAVYAENLINDFGGFNGITPDAIIAFIKGTGILGAIAGLIFVLIKFKVIRLVSVDRGSEWIRAKWGVEQYYRFGKRRGRLVRLKAGRHLLLRGVYDGWEICRREIPLVIENLNQPFRDRVLQFDRITINYKVIAPDTPRGDKLMLRSFLSVRNLDKDNQKSESLDAKVVSITLAKLGAYLHQAQADDFGQPLLSATEWVAITQKTLRKKHGVRLTSVEWTAPTWTVADGANRIAQALSFARIDQSVAAGAADVVELANHTHTA